MRIGNNETLNGVRYSSSPNRGGVIDPKFIVMHYTAGFTAESAVETLTNPSSRASAHVVVDYDGTITQLVPFNVKAWHAGPSRYKGYNGLNNHSIGIEIVNIGWVRKFSDGTYGRNNWRRTERDLGPMIASPHQRVGGGTFYWPEYPEAQLEAVERLTEALVARYGIRDIVSHEEIDTRGWKTDPGPAFPMGRFKKLLGHRDDDREELYVVTASTLNVRGGPGTRFEVVDSLPRGATVRVMEKRNDWARIEQGWVFDDFLRLL